MPLYEYQCEACGKRFEVIQKFSDPPAETCRICSQGPVQRLISSPAIQFKGTGWYITDYSQKGKSSASESAPPSAKTESKSSDCGGSTSDSSTYSSSSSPPSTPAA
jgi:putative FmdB family regulatory protein